MKFGCCTSLFDDLILSLASAGADYAEIPLSQLAEASAAKILERREALSGAGISCEAGNVLFPGTTNLYEDDDPVLAGYLEDVFAKASLLGIKIAVFGSGGPRQAPEGMGEEQAFQRLSHVCREIMVPAARRHQILCCLEPLRRQETNMINSVARGYELVKSVASPEFRLLCDLYHLDSEHEPLSHLTACGDELSHLHIASAKNGRKIPQAGDGEDYFAFFRTLKELGYAGRMSLEGDLSQNPLPTIASSLAYLRGLAESTGL